MNEQICISIEQENEKWVKFYYLRISWNLQWNLLKAALLVLSN